MLNKICDQNCGRLSLFKLNNIKFWAVMNIFFVFAIDQCSKNYMLAHLDYNIASNIFNVINNKLNFGANLFLTYNYGTAFSIIRSASGYTVMLLILSSILISLILFYWLFKENIKNKLTILSISLVIGGALGNVYDRINFGYVIDFIDVYAGNAHWPVFNLADSAISIGAALLCWQLLFGKNN